jgi:histidyl-tRNA synthetase
MLNIKDTTAKSTAELLQRAIEAANSFGFCSMDEAISDIPAKRLKAANKVTHVHTRDKTVLPIMRKLAARDAHKVDKHILGYEINTGSESTDNFSLNIANSESPLAEATLIAAAYTLLDSIGISDPVVHINSFGTTESFTRYIRDLNRYLKKISKDTPLQVQSDMAVSPMRAYARLSKVSSELAQAAPIAVDYLNDDGRSHLWGLLEYLEGAEIPYVLDNSVVAGTDYFEHTLFEIKDRQANNLLAYGGRYSILGRKAFKKHIPATGITIDIAGKGARKPKLLKSKTMPQFYFAQLGCKAKRVGLKVLRLLHNAGIQVSHDFTQEELVRQMAHIDAQSVPYIIIIGQKEALDDTVIVRDASTHKQRVLPTSQLIKHLKKLQG